MRGGDSMSTRSEIQFKSEGRKFQVYHHSDGYPSWMIPHLQSFFKWNNTRNDDLSYTVANFILFCKLKNAIHSLEWTNEREGTKTTLQEDFKNGGSNMSSYHTGIGVADVSDKINEEFLYFVDLDNKTITIANSGQVIKFGEEIEEKVLEAMEG